MNKFLKLASMLMVLFAFTTNAQSLKEWGVESYQGWSYNTVNDSNFQNSNFYFQEAYVHLNASVDKFDLNVSARVDKEKSKR